MKLTTTKTNLLTALAKVGAVIPAKSTLPILTHVWIDCNVVTTVTGSCLDQTIQVLLDGTAGFDDGLSICLPYKRLVAVVKAVPAEQIEITVNNMQADIKSGAFKIRLSGLDPADFPQHPELTNPVNHTIDPDNLDRVLKDTVYAVSTNDMRPILNGVYLNIQEDALTAVATDGHKLSWIGPSADYEAGIVIPTGAVKILRDMCRKGAPVRLEMGSPEDTVSEANAAITNEKFAFLKARVDGYTLWSRLIGGGYVNYAQVIPTKNDKTLTLDLQTLKDAIGRVGIMSDPMTHQITMTMNGSVLIEVEGEAKEDLGISTGFDLTLAINAEFATDVLSHVPGDQVTLRFGDPASAILVDGEPDPDRPHKTILMPIRLTD